MFSFAQVQGEIVYPGSDMEKNMRGTRVGIHKNDMMTNFESKLIQFQDSLTCTRGS